MPVGGGDPPERLDHPGALLVGHRLLDQPGELHRVLGAGLGDLGLGADPRAGLRRQPVVRREHGVDAPLLLGRVAAVGARHAHHQRRQRQAGVLGGERIAGRAGRRGGGGDRRAWPLI